MELPAVRRAAELHQPRVASAFIRMIEATRASIVPEELEARLGGSAGDVLNYLDLTNRMIRAAEGTGVGATKTSFKESLQNVYRAGAEAAVSELATVEVQKAEKETVGMTMSFDLLNPEAVKFIQNYSFDLIRAVSEESRSAIRDIVLGAFKKGGHPYEQARHIRKVIGLTKRQTQAVTNFIQMLSGGPSELREALTRVLRDHRFDRTIERVIEESGLLTPKQIQTMADRYYKRYLNYRAETVARTETLRASNSGAQESWRQAVDQGLLDSQRTRQRWLIAHDERTCEACHEIPRVNPDGVALGSPFKTSSGPVDGPPLHPNCRCTIGLMFTKR